MSLQSDYGILVASPAAYDRPPDSSRWLIESCRRYGIELALLGQGQPFPNNRHKTRLVAEHLRAHPQYRYVLQVDFKDVVFCATLRELFAKYRSLGHAIVAAGERVCWPLGSHLQRSPETGTSFRYLNAGTMLATAEAWLAAWDLMQDQERRLGGQAPEQGVGGAHIFNEDQAAWSELYVNGQADIVLDARCDLFQVLNQTDWYVGTANRDLHFEGRRVLNRETGGRPCLIHANANIPLDPWARYVLEPSPVWIWPLIERVRTTPLPALRSPAAVEQLLLDLGLHDPLDGCVPETLLPYTGKGLAIWQTPSEFARYLIWLSAQPPIRSYMEIGVEAGGSFITTIEYLRRFHPLELALGIDPWLSPAVHDYVSRTGGVHFVQGTHSAPHVQQFLRQAGGIDLVLIDGDHGHASVRADWEFARAASRYVAFHDVAAGNLPGVTSLWAEIRSTHRRTWEFVADGSPHRWGGLGVVELAAGGT